MLARQIAQSHVLNKKLVIPIGDVGLGGQGWLDHWTVDVEAGRGAEGLTGLGPVDVVGVVAVVSKGLAGTSVCGSVAR